MIATRVKQHRYPTNLIEANGVPTPPLLGSVTLQAMADGSHRELFSLQVLLRSKGRALGVGQRGSAQSWGGGLESYRRVVGQLHATWGFWVSHENRPESSLAGTLTVKQDLVGDKVLGAYAM